MSAHGTRSTGRHLDADLRERFEIGHVVFEVCDHPENGVTFALRAGLDPMSPRVPPPLFSGHVGAGMARQLRRLAHRLDDLEEKIGAGHD